MSKKKSKVHQDTGSSSADGRPAVGVVGLGASAGGLAAFEAFFSALSREQPGDLAFVVVQHLSPDHKSILSELLQRQTPLHVLEVEDGMAVQAGCVYIIPPNRDLSLAAGKLQLTELSAPRGHNLPIDAFFRSLAADQQERAICVVLSGTGTDGTLGVRSVKAAGGMVMVQTPETAAYDGMPRSALSTGQVDYILAPEEMPGQLLAYVNRALSKASDPEAQRPNDEDALRRVFQLLSAHTGHDFAHYKRNNVMRRIERRLAVHQIQQLEDYVRYLQQNPPEVQALFGDLLIGVTSFFRDPSAFEALQERVIPDLFAGRPQQSPIRVWVPGCSTGEEAYSIAILLQEQVDALQQSVKIQFFATDIDRRAIEQARAGLYPASIEAEMSPQRLSRFFQFDKGDGLYRIRKDIRDMLIFSEQSVIKDPPFSKVDLISCRNLLIYLDSDLHKKLIPLFHYALNPGGYLFLGSAETVGELGHLFTALDRKEKIYQRKEGHSTHPALGRFFPLTTDAAALRPTKKSSVETVQALRNLTERALLQQYSAAAVLVNGAGEILYLHGRTGLYLEPAPGEAALNVLKMAREGLRLPLIAALRQVVAQQAPVYHPDLQVKTNGDFSPTHLTVRAVGSEPRLYLIVLEPALPGAGQSLDEADHRVIDVDERIAELKSELRAKEGHLQVTNGELETSNEELRSSNEEMQSINEELQAANEELETAKEELQSINEELSTVNSELQTRVLELSQANNDMNNLLAGTGVGTIFVDHQLCIKRFTPTVTQVINLIQGDVGRPVGHVVSNLVGYDSLVEDLRSVLDSLIPKDVEVQTRTGSWFLLRIRPYRTLENVIEGAVITFVDITQMRQAQAAASASEHWLRQLSESLPQLVCTCRADGQCDFFSQQWLDYTGLPPAKQLGLDWTRLTPPTDRASILEAWSRLIAHQEKFDIELQLCGKDGIYRRFQTRAAPLQDGAGRVTRWFVTATVVGG